MNCPEFREWLDDLLLRDLHEAPPADAALHLAGCDACAREHARALEALRAITPRTRRGASPAFTDRVMGAIAAAAPTAVATEGGNAPRRFGDLARRRTTHAVTAVVLAATVLMAVTLFPIGTSLAPLGDGAFTLITQAASAEERLFAAADLVGLAREIVVEPLEDPALIEARWLPLLSIGADGQIQYNQLKLGGAPRETYTVRDEMWYDPASHRFAHTVSLKGRVLFANAYDGRSLHLLELDPQGNPRMKDEPVAGAFQVPSDPTGFLGIFSFVKTSKPSPGRNTTFRDEGPTRLADGGPAHVVRLSSTASEGNPMSQAHFLVTIRDRDHVVESIACVFQGHKLYTVRRAQAPVPREPQCGWDLAGLRPAVEKDKGKAGPKLPVQMLADMVRPSITVEQMLKAADYPVYVLDHVPHWTLHRQIVDVLDLPSPPHRMFAAVYPAREKRHVVLIQAHSFNQALDKLARSGKLLYTSPAGVKVWSNKNEKQMAEVLLTSSGATGMFTDPPAQDRSCYLLETPQGTMPVIAINGTLTEAELHELANSLVPAKAK